MWEIKNKALRGEDAKFHAGRNTGNRENAFPG